MTDKWIHVEDQRPLIPSWVLVYADGAMNCMWYDSTGFTFKPMEVRHSNIEIELITHWRSLPDPPG